MFERSPAVAGYFYPSDPKKLEEEVKRYLSLGEGERKEALGIICPHAGWVYSGKTAGKVVSSVRIPDRVVVLCPNHTGAGEDISIYPPGRWIFPGFSVKIDDEIFEALEGYAKPDTGAHLSEHSAEVIIPFLYFSNPALRIVVVCIGTLDRKKLRKLAEGVLKASESFDFLVVASSDMNHYEPDSISREKDSLALERIKKLDPEGLFDVALQRHITMCGLGPVYTLLLYAKEKGAKEGELIDYSNSADVTGDPTSVVGYAGVRIV